MFAEHFGFPGSPCKGRLHMFVRVLTVSPKKVHLLGPGSLKPRSRKKVRLELFCGFALGLGGTDVGWRVSVWGAGVYGNSRFPYFGSVLVLSGRGLGFDMVSKGGLHRSNAVEP